MRLSYYDWIGMTGVSKQLETLSRSGIYYTGCQIPTGWGVARAPTRHLLVFVQVSGVSITDLGAGRRCDGHIGPKLLGGHSDHLISVRCSNLEPVSLRVHANHAHQASHYNSYEDAENGINATQFSVFGSLTRTCSEGKMRRRGKCVKIFTTG
ncbi:Hypothetical predicted protein [Cloeon dipterum]|uniref:Uncharacterized protein n=1 Tax=Cloeon dipterum TaxID=197152 RepID=A0A8S1DE29_9INSE|nr:Hypothetical predicted protein [Cloeon dipterum]